MESRGLLFTYLETEKSAVPLGGKLTRWQIHRGLRQIKILKLTRQSTIFDHSCFGS